MAVNLHTADLTGLMTVQGIGRARATAIIQLRESEDGLTMLGLVNKSNMGQAEWARLYQAGTVTMEFPAEQLEVPGGEGQREEGTRESSQSLKGKTLESNKCGSSLKNVRRNLKKTWVWHLVKCKWKWTATNIS